MSKKWSKEEDNLLKEMYPKFRVREVLQFFPDRTIDSITTRVSKKLKIKSLEWTTPQGERWSKEEDSILINNIGKNSLIPLLPKRTSLAIYSRARLLRLRGNRSKVLRKVKRKYSVNKNFFNKPNIVNSYWAGLIASDGYINMKSNFVSISAHPKNINHLKLFAIDCTYNGPIRTYQKNTQFKSDALLSTITINGVSEWITDLRYNFSIVPRKSLILRAPNKLNKECSIAFILGFLDGDGWIGTRENGKRICLGWCSGSKQILCWIKEQCDEYFPYQNTKPLSEVKHYINNGSKNLIYYYGFSGKRAEIFLNYSLKLNVPKLYSKWEIFNEFMEKSK